MLASNLAFRPEFSQPGLYCQNSKVAGQEEAFMPAITSSSKVIAGTSLPNLYFMRVSVVGGFGLKLRRERVV
jgi:hypothetical protein